MHPRQRPLAAELEEVWLAALGDAGIDANEALLYPLEGRQSQSGYNARYLARHLELQAEADWPEFEPLLEEMNDEECIDAYRIVVFTERTIEGIGAAVRHELEHSLQREAHGQRLLELHGVAEAVICERVGGLPGGGFLYQAIPDEMDANAAAAVFARSQVGAAERRLRAWIASTAELAELASRATAIARGKWPT